MGSRLRPFVLLAAVAVVLGGLASNHYSFMGAQRDVLRIEKETGPDVGRRLRDDGADVALITPT